MKFLYSHRTRSADGQWVHISALIDALRARGHDVAVAGPGAPNKALSADDGPAAPRMPRALYELGEWAYSLRSAQRLLAMARGDEPDILYERYNLFHHGGAWAARRLKIPLLLEINAPLAEERARHGGLTLQAAARAGERRLWRAAAMALPVSDALARTVRAAGVADGRIAVIRNGVGPAFLGDCDPRQVREQYGLADRTVLGFAGFVRDWHGVDNVIDWMARRARDDCVLFIVGDGPARAGLMRRADECGLGAQVICTGVVQRDAMADHVATFDVALQPAATPYAAPLKLFEYMALGKAILAPDAANIREILTDGANGRLFAAGDARAFDAALSQLVGDDAARRRLGAAARDTLLREDYTWSGNARRVEQIAERVLENRR